MFSHVFSLWRRPSFPSFFFFNDTATTEIYTLSLHDALPIYGSHLWRHQAHQLHHRREIRMPRQHELGVALGCPQRSEEHTSELQSRLHLVCRLLLEKKKKNIRTSARPPLQTS